MNKNDNDNKACYVAFNTIIRYKGMPSTLYHVVGTESDNHYPGLRIMASVIHATA